MTKLSLEDAMRQIAEQALVMVTVRERVERLLERDQRLFVGRKYEPFKSGNLAGLYQITDVDISSYDGAITAHGRKITSRGLGDRRWDLGRIHLTRFR